MARVRAKLELEYDRTGRVWRAELREADGGLISEARDAVRGLTLDEAMDVLREDLRAFVRDRTER